MSEQMTGWEIALGAAAFIAVVIGIVLGAVHALAIRKDTTTRAWLRDAMSSCRTSTAADQLPPERRLPQIGDNVDNDDNHVTDNANGSSRIYVIDDVRYVTELAAPSPSYDEALTMKRAVGGDVVRFAVGQGDDAAVFEFSMPTSMTEDGRLTMDIRGPPPSYSELLVSTRLQSINRCGSVNHVVDPVASFTPASG